MTLATAIRLRKKRSLVEELTDSGHVRTRKFATVGGLSSGDSDDQLEELLSAAPAKHLTQTFRGGDHCRRMQPAGLSGQSFDWPGHTDGSDDLARRGAYGRRDGGNPRFAFTYRVRPAASADCGQGDGGVAATA